MKPESLTRSLLKPTANIRLTASQKQAIAKHCFAEYKKSVVAFEKVVPKIASAHPSALMFAKEMNRRLYAIAKAYSEISSSSTKDSLVRELKQRLDATSWFASDHTATGSVGFNPLAIEKALRDGTFREQMMLTYASVWPLLEKVCSDLKLVAQINKKLKGDFQINRVTGPTIFPVAAPLAKFRKAGGRIPREVPLNTQRKIGEITHLTLREARATLQRYICPKELAKLKDECVRWVNGKALFDIDKTSPFYRQAFALELPVISGPSGTADSYLVAIRYLGMESYREAALMALIGWMVPAGDHSIHEIRVAGTWHGIPYTPGAKAFETAFSSFPGFQKKIHKELAAHGRHLPGFYLRRAFKYEIAKQLGLNKLPPTKIRLYRGDAVPTTELEAWRKEKIRSVKVDERTYPGLAAIYLQEVCKINNIWRG